MAKLCERPRFGVVSQTTQPIDKVRHLVQLIRKRFPQSEVCFIDTVCQPTKQRQNAAIELAQKCDVVVVIGGEHSNNTQELVKTCARFCARVHHVQAAEDLQINWFADAQTAGITAGTSTPDAVINGVEFWLKELGARAAAPKIQTGEKMCIRDSLYVLRHGIAVEPGTPGYEKDSERPLTPKGRHQPVSYTHLDVYKRQAVK